VRACKKHLDDIGPLGLETHIGTDGSTPESRARRQGVTYPVVEVLSFNTEAIFPNMKGAWELFSNEADRNLTMDPSYAAMGTFNQYHSSRLRASCVMFSKDLPTATSAGPNLKLRMFEDNKNYTCTNDNNTLCHYNQTKEVWPTITNATIEQSMNDGKIII